MLQNVKKVLANSEPSTHGPSLPFEAMEKSVAIRPSLQACVLDQRYVLSATTTPEMIAKTIVHETTHAKLDHFGIGYDEKERARIEAVCMRRELAFAAKLPEGKSLEDEVERTMEWCAANPEFFSNARMHERSIEGHVEALRHVGMPEWFIQGVLRIKIGISAMRRLVRRVAPPARRASG
jgi:hypothetical protein